MIDVGLAIFGGLFSGFLGYTFGYFYPEWLKRKNNKLVKDDGTIKFNWSVQKINSCTTNIGYLCPKCDTHHLFKNNKCEVELKYCECEEYHKSHFHCNCPSCGFNSIMRTADDK